jgi:hypothetical protein
MAEMKVLFEDSDGLESTYVPDSSADASVIGSYWHAVGEVLAGERDSLAEFDSVEINGRFLMTDLGDLEDIASEGELNFDDIYEDA